MRVRHRLFGIDIDVLTFDHAVETALGFARRRDGECRYIVTPNVDHVLLYQRHEGLRAAYQDAALVIADGFPVVWASWLLGRPLPMRVTGSDLVVALFARAPAAEPLRAFLLGAAPGVAERAAAVVHKTYSGVRVVGWSSPPMGFERDPAENDRIVAEVERTSPDVLVVGLGAPKQELWVHAHRARLSTPLALCVGASIDFLAGHKRRAPVWMQRAGLEWLHRAGTEPRRLARRYARNALEFPPLVLEEWRRERRRTSTR